MHLTKPIIKATVVVGGTILNEPSSSTEWPRTGFRPVSITRSAHPSGTLCRAREAPGNTQPVIHSTIAGTRGVRKANGL